MRQECEGQQRSPMSKPSTRKRVSNVFQHLIKAFRLGKAARSRKSAFTDSEEEFPATESGVADSESYGPPAQETIVRDAAPGKHTATVVFLHGLGDTGKGMLVANIVDAMAALSHIKWVMPSAMVMPVSVNRGLRMPSWFDVFDLTMGSDEDSRSIDLAARHVASILKEEQKDGVRVAVGGISQGGALALYLTVRKALGTFLDGSDASSVPIAATVALNTWLPSSAGVDACAVTEGCMEVAARQRVLMGHGTSDGTVDYEWGKTCAEQLKSAGFSSLTFNTYPGMGHLGRVDELIDMRKWLQDNL